MAVHSACVGGATNMICFGDIRYCTKDAWFQVKETALGMVWYLAFFVELSASVIGSLVLDKFFGLNRYD